MEYYAKLSCVLILLTKLLSASISSLEQRLWKAPTVFVRKFHMLFFSAPQQLEYTSACVHCVFFSLDRGFVCLQEVMSVIEYENQCLCQLLPVPCSRHLRTCYLIFPKSITQQFTELFSSCWFASCIPPLTKTIFASLWVYLVYFLLCTTLFSLNSFQLVFVTAV